MRILKYLVLILPALLALYVVAPYGDRCSGLVHVLGWLILAVVYMVVFLIITAIDLYARVVGKKPFDLVPILITGIAGIVYWTFTEAKNLKPWTDRVWAGKVDLDDTRSATLNLYADGSFDALTAYPDWSCTYVGAYAWRNDTLQLLRSDLTRVTDSVFATLYRLTLPEGLLLPIESGFRKIKATTNSGLDPSRGKVNSHSSSMLTRQHAHSTPRHRGPTPAHFSVPLCLCGEPSPTGSDRLITMLPSTLAFNVAHPLRRRVVAVQTLAFLRALRASVVNHL